MRRHTFNRAALMLGLSVPTAGWSGAKTLFAAPAEQALPAGAVVSLAGTPHLWVADEGGVLHWAGDTRALANRTVAWSDRREVGLDDLRAMQRGDPWLSAGLLKSGEPIYFVKWETDWAQPQLLRIQSIPDLELFGIGNSNYGQYVMEEGAWRQRFPFDPNTLTTGTLPKATSGAIAPGTTPTPTVALVARRLNQFVLNRVATHEVEISGATPNTRLRVSGTYDQAVFNASSVRISRTEKGSFPLEDAGLVTPQGTLMWRRVHPPYTGAVYTFVDTFGNKVSITFTGD
jgi:hypothetical protein